MTTAMMNPNDLPPDAAIPQRRICRAVAAVLAMILIGAGLVGVAAPATPVQAAPADEVAVTSGSLMWGFKQSWRNYTGNDHQMSGGATRDTAGVMTFPVVGGGYDPVDRVTRLEFGGSAHFEAHPEGDINVLDLTMSNPRVTISHDTQVLSMEIVSRAIAAPHDFVDFGRVDVAALDISDTVPTIDAGTTSWSSIPTNIVAFAATEVFGTYSPGQVLDPLSFSYQGPGGAPDFSEVWDRPGTVTLEPGPNVMLDPAVLQDGAYNIFYVDQANRLVYDFLSVLEFVPPANFNARQSLRVFDMASMQLLGSTDVYTGSIFTALASTPSFVDTTTGRVFLQGGDGSVTSWVRWDGPTQQFVTGSATVPFPTDFASALWDHVNQRALNIQFTGSGENRVWSLHAYAEAGDGTWSEVASHPLPSGPAGLNLNWYQSVVGPGTNTVAVASDGSLVMTRGAMPLAPGTVSPTISALRLQIGPSGVAVSEIAGTALPNVGNEPYSGVYTGPDGQVTLVRRGAPLNGVNSKVQNLRVAADGSSIDLVGPQADLDTMTLDGVSVDPVDGTVWLRGGETRSLAAVRDGVIIYREYFEYLNRGHSALLVGPDHRVHTQTFDPTASGGLGVNTFGWVSFDRVGASPTVTEQPESASVVLPTGVTSTPVSFTAAAVGDADPAVRWQVRSSPTGAFTDIEGATATTLHVDASAGNNGLAYRAVFSNAIGSLATEVATLTVEYAPTMEVAPTNQTVIEGRSALFKVMPSGHPFPVVTWQRQVSGFWLDVPADATDAVVEGGFLTIPEATLAMSGTRFRARLANRVGTVYSPAVTLTVNAATPPEPGFPGDGTGTWGIRTSYRNYLNGPVAQGTTTVAGGVVWLDGPGNAKGPFTWPVEAATFDPATVTGRVSFAGSVFMAGHDYGLGHLLEMTWSDLTLDIAGTVGTLRADLNYRPYVGVNPSTPPPALQLGEDVPFATVDLSGVDWSLDGAGAYDIVDAPTVAVADAMTLIGWDQFYSTEFPTIVLDALSISFRPGAPTEPVPTFSDVGEGHLFFEAISWLASEGIATGYVDGTFRPTEVVSRQSAAAFLWRLAGEPAAPVDAPTFSDVGEGHLFFEAISWLASEGIATGYVDGTFRPTEVVSRQSAAAFLWRLAGEPAAPVDAPTFSDVGEGHLFFEAISWLASEGIATGYVDETFRPTDVVTRQSIAAFLYRYEHRTTP